jgi:hypothetical protein
MLHVNFAKAIKAGMIKVVAHFWKWRLPGLYNWNDVDEYYKEKK